MNLTREYLEARRERLAKITSLRVPKPGGLCSFAFDRPSRIETDETRLLSLCRDPLARANGRWCQWYHATVVPHSLSPAIQPVTRKAFPSVENTNSEWDSILRGLNHVGRPSGDGPAFRPEGEHVIDLTAVAGGYDIVDAAHVLTHLQAIENPSSVTRTSFLDNVAKMVVALRFGLSIRVPTFNGRDKPDDFERYGILVLSSVNIRRPWLSVPVSSLVPFKTLCAVLVGIQLEPHPFSARSDNPNDEDKSWLELNRWSELPTVTCLCGWKCVDELSKAPVTVPFDGAGRDKWQFTLPVTGLDRPSEFGNFVKDVMGSVGPSYRDGSAGVWDVEEWISSDEYARARSCTPPLPCKECMRLNLSAEGAPVRPAHPRPDKMPKKGTPKHRMTLAEREWSDYDEHIGKIFDIVEKATEFHESRTKGIDARKERRKRRSSYAKAMRLVQSSCGKSNRASAMRRKGEITKALKLENESKELHNQAMEMMK